MLKLLSHTRSCQPALILLVHGPLVWRSGLRGLGFRVKGFRAKGFTCLGFRLADFVFRAWLAWRAMAGRPHGSRRGSEPPKALKPHAP